GHYYDAVKQFDRSVETYRTLWAMFPDHAQAGLSVASAQVGAGRGRDALATIETLRTASLAGVDRARLSVIESRAAESLGDAQRQVTAAREAVRIAELQGARQIEGDAEI